MPLYRAVPNNAGRTFGAKIRRYATRRVPSNVPYPVDNLWEYLRPETMPSRRYAVYASPTPVLAMANAMADHRGSGYVACHVEIDGEFSIAQLNVPDSREHADILAITGMLKQRRAEFVDAPLEEKRLLAPLYLPGLTTEELQSCIDASPFLASFVAEATGASQFWIDATSKPGNTTGELFFELSDDASYTLTPV